MQGEVTFRDVLVYEMVTKAIFIYNADLRLDARLELSIDDVVRQDEHSTFWVDSAPSVLPPSGTGTTQQTILAFRANRVGYFEATLVVTLTWPGPTPLVERRTVVLRASTTSGLADKLAPTPGLAGLAAKAPAYDPHVGRYVNCQPGRGRFEEAADFVPHVHSIMVARKWNVAAAHQAQWLSRPANAIVGDAKDAQGNNGPLPVLETNIDWLLRYERCRRLFDSMRSPDVFANDPAKSVIAKRVRDRFQKHGGPIVPLGDPNARLGALEREYANYRPLPRQGLVTASLRSYGDIDELTAAFGRLTMYVVVYGQADRLSGGRILVTIKSVGVYARDSFDFRGEQYLGAWRLPRFVAASPFGAANPTPWDLQNDDMYKFPRCGGDGWFVMTNAVYRRYREKYGYGCDFVIYSDVKTVPLDREQQFVLPAPPA